MSNQDVWKRVDYGYDGQGLKSSLSIEIGSERAEVVRDVIAANPEATGYTLPIEVKPGVYIMITNESVWGTSGLRRIHHVNGKVREVHNSIEHVCKPRFRGSKLEFDVVEGSEPRTDSKRVWGTLIWDYL